MKNVIKSIQTGGAALVMTTLLAAPGFGQTQNKATTSVARPAQTVQSRPPAPPPPHVAPSRVEVPTSPRPEQHTTPGPETHAGPPVRTASPPAGSGDHRGPATHPTSPGAVQTRPAHTAQPAPAPVGRTAVNQPAPLFRPVETRRVDGTRIVAAGHGRGFVERPIVARPGFVARTYVAGGRTYARVYRSYAFRGYEYHRYVPAFYFQPGFYAWAYNPWAVPVVFSWGFGAAPWYGYYGPYYAPARVYTGPSLWLTDFVIAENLKAAYEARLQAGDTESEENGQAAITPEIKELISQQVRLELAAAQRESAGETASAAPGTPAALDPSQRVFVVSMNLNVAVGGEGACQLSPGDIILRNGSDAYPDGRVGVTVLSSKSGDCAANSTLALELTALEEMHNDFRQQLDAGLSVLAVNQGKGGLPNGPAPNPRAALDGQAPADLDATSALLSQLEASRRNQ